MTNDKGISTLQNIEVYHYKLHNKHELAEQWRDLYNRIDSPSVFLSWNWICRWLSTLPNAPIVVEAKLENHCIGLGIFHTKSKFIFPGWFIKQIWLHRTGDSPLDQVWIEYNDFLLDSGLAKETRLAMIDYIASELTWHECFVGLTSCDVLQDFDSISSNKRIDVDSPEYYVNLKQFVTLDDYINSLSKNTKQQLIRSFKLLRQEGLLVLHEAQTQDEQTSAFNEMAEIHIDKWRKTKYGSGFDNPHFNHFHKDLINTDQDNRFTSIFCLSLNGQKLAFIYLLKVKDCWYFYLSAIKSYADNRIKVGHVAHAMIIEAGIKQNISKYDFLAGEARYKRSLSNNTGPNQQLICYYKPSRLLHFRHKVRTLKQHCFNKLKIVSKPEC